MYMELKKTINGNKATVEIEGRIDASNAPEYEKALLALPAEVKALDIDLSDVEYISSAGLRMLLVIQKAYDKIGGSLRLTGVADEVLEIFEVTGFNEFLTIKQ